MELVHNFSLRHDDVMDGDQLPRHRPTTWSVFGVPAVILASPEEIMPMTTPAVTPLIEFRFPFPRALSPDHEAASAAVVRWARRMGLATTPFAVERLTQWNWGRLTGHCLPTARGADLELAAQWMTFGFLFDDQFNGRLGRCPDLALRVVEDMIAALYDEPGPGTGHPARRALADVVARLAAARSPVWLARFREHMREYFTGVLRQSTYQLDFRCLDFAAALELRRVNIAMQPLIDLIEVVEHQEIPAALIASPLMRALRQIVVDIVIYQNDVFSLPKDRRQQEVNVILALERDAGLDAGHALARISDLIAEEVRHFAQLKAELPRLCQLLGLTEHDRTQLDRYVHCLELMIHGCVYSHAECIRYATESRHLLPLGGTGYIEDLRMDAGVDTEANLIPGQPAGPTHRS